MSLTLGQVAFVDDGQTDYVSVYIYSCVYIYIYVHAHTGTCTSLAGSSSSSSVALGIAGQRVRKPCKYDDEVQTSLTLSLSLCVEQYGTGPIFACRVVVVVV